VTTCVKYLDEAAAALGDDLTQCGAATSATVFAACVHEHMSTSRVCGPCARGLADVDPAEWICVACADSSQPHRCLATMVITMDDQAAMR
jgi:hypothetical protein